MVSKATVKNRWVMCSAWETPAEKQNRHYTAVRWKKKSSSFLLHVERYVFERQWAETCRDVCLKAVDKKWTASLWKGSSSKVMMSTFVHSHFVLLRSLAFIPTSACTPSGDQNKSNHKTSEHFITYIMYIFQSCFIAIVYYSYKINN